MQSRKKKAWIAAAATLLAAAAAAGLLFAKNLTPAQAATLPGCWLYDLTGLYCAGCGDTRALLYLLHGQFYRGFRMNPLAVLAAPALFAALLWVLVRLFRGRPLPRPPLWAVWAVFALIVLYTVARNLPWLPFRWLAPTELPWVR